ncbi:MAG: hypothetical protein M3511_11895, partial [Deinococcota bacterium]|nr:hypothetical protein [Deinococcota bacterium]
MLILENDRYRDWQEQHHPIAFSTPKPVSLPILETVYDKPHDTSFWDRAAMKIGYARVSTLDQHL